MGIYDDYDDLDGLNIENFDDFDDQDDFGDDFDSDLNEFSDDIKEELLRSMEFIDKKTKNRKKITVKKLLGNIEFKPVDKVPVKKLSYELDILLEIFNENNIVIETLVDVEPYELYRFITEEVVAMEIPDVRDLGIKQYINYEDFYPNHEYNVKLTIEEFLDSFCEQDFPDAVKSVMAKEMISNGKKILQNQAFKSVESYRKEHEGFRLIRLEEDRVDISDDLSKAVFEGSIEYIVTEIAGRKTQTHTGKAFFELSSSDNNLWLITKVEIPEFKI